MPWYAWRFWRVAYSRTHREGPLLDGRGLWRNVVGGVWILTVQGLAEGYQRVANDAIDRWP